MDDDEFYEKDIDWFVYQLSTKLFDLRNNIDDRKIEFLDRIKLELGEDIYYRVIDGYVRGAHDT